MVLSLTNRIWVENNRIYQILYLKPWLNMHLGNTLIDYPPTYPMMGGKKLGTNRWEQVEAWVYSLRPTFWYYNMWESRELRDISERSWAAMHGNCSRKKPINVLLMATVKVVGKGVMLVLCNEAAQVTPARARCPKRVLEACTKHGNHVVWGGGIKLIITRMENNGLRCHQQQRNSPSQIKLQNVSH